MSEGLSVALRDERTGSGEIRRGGNVLHSGTEEQFETLESYEAEVRGLTLIAGVLGTEGMQGRVEFL